MTGRGRYERDGIFVMEKRPTLTAIAASCCSEPDNMRYMIRLGSYGFSNMGEMINELKRYGVEV